MSKTSTAPSAPTILQPRTRRRAPFSLARAVVGCMVIACIAPSLSAAAPTTMVNLGSAATYAVLSGASVGNTVSADGAPHTTLRGDLGVNVSTQPTGFPPGIVTGAVNVGNAAATQAYSAAAAAYTEVAARTGGAALAGALAGATILPGLYTIGGAVSNTATVTLDGGGDPNAVFVFQVNGAMAMAAGSRVVLTNGARASRVFWQVNGAGAVGAAASFAGTLMALNAVAIGNGSLVNGRAFALTGALTLDANDVYSAPPALTIAGGATAITTHTTPTIGGTTDVTAPAVVTVTINGQTLTATPSGGAWSVTSTILANNTYPIVASVTDGAGNPGSASQQLTIDTVPPVITLDGGPASTTNDPTPSIAGTSDVAPGTIVRIAIDSQSLTALVQPGGHWNVTPATLSDGTRNVTASVSDPAGNPGSASRLLTVVTAAPVVTISGGASALSNDTAPVIAGTAGVAPGTVVSVTLADQTLSGIVQDDGSWSVTPTALSDGPHRVVMSVSDAAGNAASLTQTLTIDTIAPAVTILCGALATRTDLDPTLVGTSDATPGTVVTVSIARQTLTTLLQANGSWNVTPTTVGAGTWAIVASVADRAGNVGRARQTLTIAAGSGGSGCTPAPSTPPSSSQPSNSPHLDATVNTKVSGDSKQKLAGSSLSIGTSVTAPHNGPVLITMHGVVRVGGVKQAIALTSTTAACAAGKRMNLKLVVKGTHKAARGAWTTITRAVKAHKSVVATLTIAITDAAGHTRTITRTVTLT
jgi:hypothetical protein